jgi:hypothetical protein
MMPLTSTSTYSLIGAFWILFNYNIPKQQFFHYNKKIQFVSPSLLFQSSFYLYSTPIMLNQIYFHITRKSFIQFINFMVDEP